MFYRNAILGCTVAAALACGQQTNSPSGGGARRTPPPAAGKRSGPGAYASDLPSQLTLPAGTWISVRTDQVLSSDHNLAGRRFLRHPGAASGGQRIRSGAPRADSIGPRGRRRQGGPREGNLAPGAGADRRDPGGRPEYAGPYAAGPILRRHFARTRCGCDRNHHRNRRGCRRSGRRWSRARASEREREPRPRPSACC